MFYYEFIRINDKKLRHRPTAKHYNSKVFFKIPFAKKLDASQLNCQIRI